MTHAGQGCAITTRLLAAPRPVRRGCRRRCSRSWARSPTATRPTPPTSWVRSSASDSASGCSATSPRAWTRGPPSRWVAAVPAHLPDGLLRRADRARRRRPRCHRWPRRRSSARCSSSSPTTATTTPSASPTTRSTGCRAAVFSALDRAGPGRRRPHPHRHDRRQRRPVLRRRRPVRRLQAERHRPRDGRGRVRGVPRDQGRRGRCAMNDQVWISGDQQTVTGPARAAARGRPRRRVPRRLRRQAVGRRGRRRPPTGWPARWPSSASRPGDRVATLVENSRRGDAGLVGDRARRRRRRARSTPPTRASTCATSSPTRGRGCSSSRPASPTGPSASSADTSSLEHVVVIGGAERSAPASPPTPGTTCSAPTTREPDGRHPPVRPGHVHLHRRHDGPVEGLHAQPQLPRGAGPPDRHLLAAHRRRRGVDAAAAVPLQRHRHRRARPARVRRPGGDLPAVLGVELLARDEPHRARPSPRRSARWPTCWPTTSTGRRCRGRARPRPTPRCGCIGAAPLPVEVDSILTRALRRRHLQRRLRRDRGVA